MQIVPSPLDLTECEAGDLVDLHRRQACIEVERADTLPVSVGEVFHALARRHIEKLSNFDAAVIIIG